MSSDVRKKKDRSEQGGRERNKIKATRQTRPAQWKTDRQGNREDWLKT